MIDGITIGWVGLGNMGRPMARRLHQAGAKTVVTSRTRSWVEELGRDGLGTAKTPREVANSADVVITMVFDTAATASVLEGHDGVLAGLRPGTLVIDMGTTSVSATARFAGAVVARGGTYIDAPVSGGTRGAAEGSLTIMVGGEEEDIRRAMPIFSVLGQRVTHMGPVGAGQATKAANQVIVGLTIAAVAEAMALACKAGVDPAKAREAMQGGFADSRILREHGLRMIEQNYAPGGTVAVQRKDLREALTLAAELGLDLPMTGLAADRFDIVAERGFNDLDQSAIFKVVSA